MIGTPRSDEEAEYFSEKYPGIGPDCVSLSFAQQLESELIQSRREYDALKDVLRAELARRPERSD